MSLGEFTQWLNVASADGHISEEEADALLHKARELGVDEGSARLLIEQKRQKFSLNMGNCPVCEHPLGEATLTMLCPNCKADLAAVRAKYTAGVGVQVRMEEVEDSVAGLLSIHIPTIVRQGNFDHAAFTAAVSNAEKALSHLETFYGASTEISERCSSYRNKIETVKAQYRRAVKRARTSWMIPVIGIVVLAGGLSAYYVFSSSSAKQQKAALVSQFNKLVIEQKFQEAEKLYEIMREQQIPEALVEKTFTRDGKTSSIPEFETWIMNGKFKMWSEPLISKIESFVNARKYDSTYALLRVLQSDFRNYPTTNSDEGLFGEECTAKIIDEIVEVAENQMFDNELQNGKLADALKVLSKVSSSERRRTLLEHALSYLMETNRLEEAEQIKVLLSN